MKFDKGFSVYLEAAAYQRIHMPIKRINYKVDSDDVIIKAGTELYHGTGENFDVREISPGGYDKILWTTDSTYIARSYIPDSGSKTFTNLDDLVRELFQDKNENSETYKMLTEQLGITQAVISKAFYLDEKNYQVFKDIDRKKKKINEEITSLSKDFRKMTVDEDDFDVISDRIKSLSEEYDNLDREEKKMPYPKTTNEYLKTIIKRKLEAYGYTVKEHGNIQEGLRFDENGDLINIKNDYRTPGKIVVVTPKRDMIFYNHARKQGFEGDLTEVQYHDHEVFERAMESGKYDGIVINDFAQNKIYGNIGHVAFGFFKNAIKDCNISSIQGQKHPDSDERLW